MMSKTPHFYHIGYTPAAEIDPAAVQKAVESIVLDWYRYTPNCYLVWADADATMIGGSMMTVPGMSLAGFFVLRVDLTAEGFGFLPNWGWEWIRKNRNQPIAQPDFSWIPTLLAPPKT